MCLCGLDIFRGGVHTGDCAAKPRKGEIVIIIAPPAAPAPASEAGLDAALAAALVESSLKTAVANVTSSLGLPRAQVYARALALKQT